MLRTNFNCHAVTAGADSQLVASARAGYGHNFATDWPRREPTTTATPVRGAITRCWPSRKRGAEASSVIILSPVWGRRIAQVKVLPDQFRQAEMLGQGVRKEQAGMGHQAVIVEGNADAVRLVAW